MRPLVVPCVYPPRSVDVQERKDQDIELRRDVLLGRVDLIDLQEVLDRNRIVPVASQLQVLDVHRLPSRVGGDADPERTRNLISPCLGFRAPNRQSRPVRLARRGVGGQRAAGKDGQREHAARNERERREGQDVLIVMCLPGPCRSVPGRTARSQCQRTRNHIPSLLAGI